MIAAGAYQPLVLADASHARAATPELARRWFDELMAARDARRQALQALWSADDDAATQLDADDAPARLGAWLVTALPGTGAALASGLAADVALWLGDRCVARAPQLRWTFYTAHKKAGGFQRAVLTGFGRVDDERYYVDVAHLVAAWIDLAARGRRARPDFLAVIEQTTLGDA
jgi:hypothetical protein